MDIFIRNKPYTGRLKAVILDWAGTCVDYGCLGPVAPFREAFLKHGVAVTLDEARGPMGVAKKDHVKALLAMPGVVQRWREKYGRDPVAQDVDDIYPDVEKMMVAAVANHAEPIPGALAALEAFRVMGLKVGTCTGYTRPMVEVLAPAAAERGLVPEAVVCASDVPAGRPFPYMCYLNAIKLEAYPLEACVKIGDTVADIQEGLNAGMWTIGVTKTGNELGLPEAEVEALPEAELRSRLAVIEARFAQAGAHYVVEGIRDCPAIVEEINLRLAVGRRPLAC
jgi:phosphonoacetaldehyde hydrolase